MRLWLVEGGLRGTAQSLRQSSLGETGHLVLFRSLRNSLGEQYPVSRYAQLSLWQCQSESELIEEKTREGGQAWLEEIR